MVWLRFKNRLRGNPKESLNIKLKEERPRGRPRTRWEQEVRKDVIQKEGRAWEETEEEKLGENRCRRISFVIRRST
jgi:hypothetical protein